MKLSRNQLVLAMLFALLLGLIITVGARCGASGTPTTRTATPTRSAATTRTPSVTARASVTTTTGISGTVAGRATDVPIAPPGSQTAPSPTPITVGPLPVLTPLVVPATTTGTGQTTTTGSSGVPTANPAPTTQSGTVATGANVTYIVKSGDSLGAVAKQFGVTSSAIMQANNIADPSRIYIGQRLIIPGAAATPGASATASATAGTVYVVKPGDSLSKIAVKYGVTVSAIVKANNLKNSNVIYSGQKLTIPPKP
jgi:LysM repeat protein